VRPAPTRTPIGNDRPLKRDRYAKATVFPRVLGLVLYALTLVSALVAVDRLDPELPFPPELLFLVPSVVAGLVLGAVAFLGPVAFGLALIVLYATNPAVLTFFDNALWLIAALFLAVFQAAAVAVGLFLGALWHRRRRTGGANRKGTAHEPNDG